MTGVVSSTEVSRGENGLNKQVEKRLVGDHKGAPTKEDWPLRLS